MNTINECLFHYNRVIYIAIASTIVPSDPKSKKKLRQRPWIHRSKAQASQKSWKVWLQTCLERLKELQTLTWYAKTQTTDFYLHFTAERPLIFMKIKYKLFEIFPMPCISFFYPFFVDFLAFLWLDPGIFALF